VTSVTVKLMARPRNQTARREALIDATYAAGRKVGLRSLSLTDVAEQAGLSRGAVLYYYDDLDALLVEAHAAGIERFCDERDRLVAETDDPRAKLAVAIAAGLPDGPDDALMRLLYEFDVLAGSSELHDEMVQGLYLRQMQSYRGILADGLSRGAFHPRLDVDQIAMTFVALEDAYGLHRPLRRCARSPPNSAALLRRPDRERCCHTAAKWSPSPKHSNARTPRRYAP
jgi:AcrR family transcriptional regulator